MSDAGNMYSGGGEYSYWYEEDRMGMTVTSGAVTLEKDVQNLIGISIGGGAPLCPCLYVVQIFDNTPAAKDGSIAAGDEIVGVNGQSVKGKTKVEVARLIQSVKTSVTINYNKLHADPKQGKTLDIVLKKVKHKVVENMSSSTADALGLSRAILCNDSMVKKLHELERTGKTYEGMVWHIKLLFKEMYHLSNIHKRFGETLTEIGIKDPHISAHEAFTKFGEAHRTLDKNAKIMLLEIKPLLSDLNTFLTKAIPDTKLTIKKYLDVKFEYLSYCLKVKEMDDEEYQYAAMQEPLYRVETGNYEYRLVLRCRQSARVHFGKMRQDCMVKMELLDQKHVQDIVVQLQKFIGAMEKYHVQCHNVMRGTVVFPIEVCLNNDIFTYGKNTIQHHDNDDNNNAAVTECQASTISADSTATLTKQQHKVSGVGGSGVDIAQTVNTYEVGEDAAGRTVAKLDTTFEDLLQLNTDSTLCGVADTSMSTKDKVDGVVGASGDVEELLDPILSKSSQHHEDDDDKLIDVFK